MVDTKQLIEQLSQQAAPVKPVRPARMVALLLAALMVYAIGMQWSQGLRVDLAMQLERPLFVVELLLLLCLCLSAMVACVLAMFPDAYQKRSMLKLPYLFAAAMLALVTFQLLLPQDGRMVMPTPQSHTMECTLYIAMASMLPAALIFVVLRKGATLVPLHAGALAVMTASSIGALTLRLAEADDAITHLLASHYLPSIGFAVVGALLGRWFLRW